MVGLSTLIYLDRRKGNGSALTDHTLPVSKPVPKLSISDCRDFAFANSRLSKQDSPYLDVVVYETICKIYMLFYNSLSTMQGSRSNFQFVKSGLAHSPDSGSATILASLIYKPEREDTKVVPDLGSWMIQGFITVYDNLLSTYQPLYNHPMERTELVKAISYKHQKEDQKGCVKPNITIWSHPTIFTPETIFNFEGIEQFPEKALVLPATGGVSLEISCDNGNNQTLAKKIIYTCVPKQYDVGNLTCMTFADSSAYQYSPQRRRRGVGKLAYALNEYFNLTHFNRSVLETYSNTFGETLKGIYAADFWRLERKLLPNIMSCGASVAGCDYCLYFLTTYNLTISPAACVGGCSLGTFASCSSLIGTSFVNTYLK